MGAAFDMGREVGGLGVHVVEELAVLSQGTSRRARIVVLLVSVALATGLVVAILRAAKRPAQSESLDDIAE